MWNALVSAFQGSSQQNIPNAVQTLPLQRTGVQDGTSGLHYSGRLYSNQFQQLSSDVCKGASASVAQIAEVMPNSISTESLSVDPATKRISTSSLQGYVQGLISSGKIPGKLGSFEQQMTADKGFYAAIQSEYCFYESRYKAALTQFLTLVSDARGADSGAVSAALTATVNLNKRLNSLLEILNYVGNSRARDVNERSPDIVKANDSLQDKINVLKKQQDFLTSSDTVTRTQEEMVRYSAEKNHAMNIQIIFFVAVNVVALGTIITVYKSVRPGSVGV
jgi:hypothetical protein